DLRLRRRWVEPQVSDEGHQDAGRAEAALERVADAEGLLQRVQARAVSREALDGVHPAAVDLDREDEAGARGLAVDQDGARSARAVLAAQMRPGEAPLPAQQIG